MRILVTGSNGQLGSEINEIKDNYFNFKFFFEDLPELDICDYELLKSYVLNNKINVIINCAAYTSVDKAENEKNKAQDVNVYGVRNIIDVLSNVNGKLIHISTDYVFDGNNSKPYKESDPISPIGIYGETKRAGELIVLNSNIDSIVIRTSWLYSSFGSNFVKTMLKLGNKRMTLDVISDQIGTPTYARDLAKVCLEILSSTNKENINKNGKIYHYSNEGVASWYDFAVLIMQIAKLNCKVNPIQTKDYPTLAKRPLYSVLNKTKIKKDFKIQIPDWEESLKECIIELK